MLTVTIPWLSRAFICIDALDEFGSNNLLELLVSLREIIRMIFTKRASLPHWEDPVEDKL